MAAAWRLIGSGDKYRDVSDVEFTFSLMKEIPFTHKILDALTVKELNSLLIHNSHKINNTIIDYMRKYNKFPPCVDERFREFNLFVENNYFTKILTQMGLLPDKYIFIWRMYKIFSTHKNIFDSFLMTIYNYMPVHQATYKRFPASSDSLYEVYCQKLRTHFRIEILFGLDDAKKLTSYYTELSAIKWSTFAAYFIYKYIECGTEKTFIQDLQAEI